MPDVSPAGAPLPRRRCCISRYCLAPCRYLNIGNETQVQHVLSKWDEYVVFGFARNVSSQLPTRALAAKCTVRAGA